MPIFTEQRKMIKIEILGPDEWEAYRNVRLNALEDTPDAFGSTLERELAYVEADWRNRLERNDCVTCVAFADNASPVGVVVGAPNNDEAGLYAMWVNPKYRRLGIGSALIDEVVRWARENDFSKLFLDVADSNESAGALYEIKGFTRTGTIGTLPHPREHITEHQRCLIL